MRISFKLLSVVLVVVLMLTGLNVFGVSAEATYTQPEKFIYGDVDMDGVVTVKDATLVQKSVAGICLLSATQKYIIGSTEPTVKSATEIQKFVAGSNMKSSLIGKEIEKSKYGVFSEKINAESRFEDDSIVVLPKEGFQHIYTLDDFPEYNFESLMPIGECYEGQYLGYTLIIANPSKNNIIEAIKALEYRGNYDLEVVSPNYIYSYN